MMLEGGEDLTYIPNTIIAFIAPVIHIAFPTIND